MGSSSLARNQTRASCIGSTESYPLDYQGNPHCTFRYLKASSLLPSHCLNRTILSFKMLFLRKWTELREHLLCSSPSFLVMWINMRKIKFNSCLFNFAECELEGGRPSQQNPVPGLSSPRSPHWRPRAAPTACHLVELPAAGVATDRCTLHHGVLLPHFNVHFWKDNGTSSCLLPAHACPETCS